jgi:hypothetical protein
VDCLHRRVEGDNRTMYKVFTLVIFVIIGTTCASSLFNNQPKKLQHLNSSFSQKQVGVDLRPECIEEAVTMIFV